jgi:GFO/IDH/MocA oxidoreductase family protein
MRNRTCILVVFLLFTLTARPHIFAKEGVLRAGIVGCDTSHVIAFSKLINNPDATGPYADVEVTVAYPGGSPDIKESRDRVDGYVKELREKFNIKIVDTLEELANECDAVMLESVDGRPHLKQFRAIAKGKPVFVDKPAAASLADLLTIFRVADETHTPVYSSSSLRFVKEVQSAATDKSIGEIVGCETFSPMSTQSAHPDLFWYGIHGVEPLFTILGPGCETVSRTDTPLSTVVVGKWKDGRIGSYRGIKNGYYYALNLYGAKKVVQATGYPGREGYDPAVRTMCEFFKSGKPPVSRQDTIEIYAFMEAADASKKEGGKPVALADIIERAQQKSAAASTSAGGGK